MYVSVTRALLNISKDKICLTQRRRKEKLIENRKSAIIYGNLPNNTKLF